MHHQRGTSIPKSWSWSRRGTTPRCASKGCLPATMDCEILRLKTTFSMRMSSTVIGARVTSPLWKFLRKRATQPAVNPRIGDARPRDSNRLRVWCHFMCSKVAVFRIVRGVAKKNSCSLGKRSVTWWKTFVWMITKLRRLGKNATIKRKRSLLKVLYQFGNHRNDASRSWKSKES